MWKGTILVSAVLGAALLFAFSAEPALAQQPKPPVLCADDQIDCTVAADDTPGNGVKWNPGHYVKTQGNHCSNQAEYFAGIQANLDSHVLSSGNIVGALVSYGWGALETNRGRYNWSRVRDTLDWLSARNKQLIVIVEPKCFGGEQSPEWMVPENLERLGDGYESYGPSITAAIWRRHVMDQAITFWRAFAQEFDGHPNLEMVSFGSESCPSWGRRADGPPGDYSHEDAFVQQVRLYDAMSAAFKETAVSAPWNCEQAGTIVNGMEALFQRGMARAGPDLCSDFGYQVFMGRNGAIRDYRGTIGHRPIVSAPNLGGKDDILPLSNVQSCVDAAAVTHLPWVMSITTPGATKDDILRHIEDPRNGVRTACPTQYEALLGGCK